MKILSKKKCDEILKRILANEIIQAKCGLNDLEAETKATENRAEIAYTVGSIRGMRKILDTDWNYKCPMDEQKLKTSEKSDTHDRLNARISEETARHLIELVTSLANASAFTGEEALTITYVCKNANNRKLELLTNN